MQNPTTVKEAFLPLAARLLEYETEKYQIEYDSIYDESFITDIEYEDIVGSLALKVNLFPNAEVHEEAKKYERRVNNIIKNLKPRMYDYRFYDGKNEMVKTKTSQKKQNELMESWKLELFTYIEYMQLIQKLTLDKGETSNVQTVNEFQLPSDFKVSIIPKTVFESNISNNEAGQFLYYLREIGIIPKYSKKSQSKLAKFLFFNSDQNVYAQLTERQFPHFKKDLKLLRERLLLMIEKIDLDIKKSK